MSDRENANAGAFWQRVTDRLRGLGHDQLWLSREIGVPQSTMSTWLNDARYPRANRAHAIAVTLGVSVSWLVTGEDTDPLISDPLVRRMYELALRLDRPDLDVIVYLMGRLARSNTAIEITLPQRRIDNDE